MCNRYANKVPFTAYRDKMQAVGRPLIKPAPNVAPNLEPRANIAPTQNVPILRNYENGVELVELRWGLIPWFYKGSLKEWKLLTTNARSENITTTASYKTAYQKRRCLIPVSWFYEWTGEKGKKTKWQFSKPDNDWFCFAGVWDSASTAEGEIQSFALLTQAAGPDMRPYHHRQPVILEPEHYATWLAGVPVNQLPESKKGQLFVDLTAE